MASTGMAYFSFSLTSVGISVILLSSTVFFLIYDPHKSPQHTCQVNPLIPHRSLLNTTFSSSSCSSKFEVQSGIFNYSYLHFCLFAQNPYLSIPSLALIILLQFYVLVKTAQDWFSVVVTKLAKHLNLSPSMGAVTLLALGNGAPDVFASVAAVRGGQARTGVGAILSAGTFVSAFVVGFVAIYAAPFSVDPAPFVRDVVFYLIAALSLSYVYLSGEIYMWQAIAFVGFYVFFVGFVFWMDVGMESRGARKKIDAEMELLSAGPKESSGNEIDFLLEAGQAGSNVSDVEFVSFKSLVDVKPDAGFCAAVGKISRIWVVPVSTLLKLTIPQTKPSKWSRFYLSANIAFCPMSLLYLCNSFLPLNHEIVFLLPNTHFPLWSVIFFASSSFALVYYMVEKEPPKTEQIPAVVVAFIMSIFWISTVAGELLDCLATVGIILELPPALLGLTVLAWGNSVGDLVADVAVAKAGQPAMAMAGCFVGPMFNMLVGLGTALVIQTVNVYPMAYELQFHLSIVVAFVFLLFSLMGSLFVVTWFRFRVPKFWGFCLVGLYILFTVVSLVIAKFSK